MGILLGKGFTSEDFCAKVGDDGVDFCAKVGLAGDDVGEVGFEGVDVNGFTGLLGPDVGGDGEVVTLGLDGLERDEHGTVGDILAGGPVAEDGGDVVVGELVVVRGLDVVFGGIEEEDTVVALGLAEDEDAGGGVGAEEEFVG